MLKYLVCGAVALLIAAPAQAHEFTVTFVVPSGDETVATQAFLLASAERDSHANETSEGHLGGVDSQLTVIAVGQLLPPSDIVVEIAQARAPANSGTNDIWMLQLAGVSQPAREQFLGTGDSAFAARYSARNGSGPGEIATLVYVAARLIDIAVRAQDGVDDIAALASAVENY